MNMRSLKILWVFLLPAVFLCRQADALAGVQTSVRDVTLDVCARSKSVVVVIEAGVIQAKDSILSYDVRLSFDPEKLRFTQALPVGTISESLEYDPVVDLHTPGEVGVEGYNVIRFITNAEPRALIALLGEYRGNCPDTLTVELKAAGYGKLFHDGVTVIETEGEIKGNAKVFAAVADKPNRQLGFEYTGSNPVEFPKGSNQSAAVNINLAHAVENGVRQFEFSIEVTEESPFGILFVRSENSEVSIDNVETVVADKKVKVQCSLGDNADTQNSFIRIDLKTLRNEDSEADLVLRPIQVNECTCVFSMLESSLVLKSVKDSITSIVDNQEQEVSGGVSVFDDGTNWTLTGKQGIRLPVTVTVYSLAGHVLKRVQWTMGNTFRIRHNDVPAGVYLLTIDGANETLTTMNIIK